jgi:hypothetical protein
LYFNYTITYEDFQGFTVSFFVEWHRIIEKIVKTDKKFLFFMPFVSSGLERKKKNL